MIISFIFAFDVGVSVEIYLVGGAVRDQLLGLPVEDRDYVVVGATPDEMLAQGFVPVGHHFPVFIHPKTHEEYALARTERKCAVGHRGFKFFTDPSLRLVDDLKRRDLTINAMAQDPQGQIIDPYGGQQDLNQRVLRHVSSAFTEDPLRVLRVARFAARFHGLGFHIAPETKQLMQQMAATKELAYLSAERVWMEIDKTLQYPNADVFFTTLYEVGALDVLMPELATLLANQQTRFLQHLRAANDASPTILFALLCRDLSVASLPLMLQRLRVPKAQADLAQLVVERLPSLEEPFALTAKQLLSLYTRTDIWRRPQRLESLLQIATYCFTHEQTNTWLDFIREGARYLQAIGVQRLRQRGFQGARLGQALAKTRLQVLEQYLVNHGQD